MIYAILYLLMLLIVIDKLHSLHTSTMVFRYQCRLFSIRDHLREGVTMGTVDSNHWLFQYLDSTIVKTIDALGRINLWRVLGLAFSSSDARTMKALVILEAELDKPKHEYVKKVYYLYQGYLLLYLLDRHPVLKFLFSLVRLGHYIESKFQRAGSIAASVSETSTLSEFAPA